MIVPNVPFLECARTFKTLTNGIHERATIDDPDSYVGE